MFCPKCGTNIQDNFQFCPQCGLNVEVIRNEIDDNVVSDGNYDSITLNTLAQGQVLPVDFNKEANKEKQNPSIDLEFSKELSSLNAEIEKIANKAKEDLGLNETINKPQQHNNIGIVETNNNTIHDTQPNNKLPQENTSQQTETIKDKNHNRTIRPEQVGTAVQLLYISLGIGVLRYIMESSMLAQMPAFVMLLAFFGLGFMGLIYMAGEGRNWARITLLVMLIIAIPRLVTLELQFFAANPIDGMLCIGQAVIQIIALIFLFQQPSSNWFREMKANKNNTIHDTQPDNKLPQENTSQQTKQSTESTEGKYRNSLQQPSKPPREEGSTAYQQPRPWVRFWARSLDVFLLSFCTGFLFGLLFPAFTIRMIKAPDAFLCFLVIEFFILLPFSEALIIAVFGNTPGKAILKTKITNSAGNSLSFAEALKRNFYVYFAGYAMWLPLINIATLLWQYRKLKKEKKTSWDNKYNLSVVHSHIGGLRITAYVGLYLVLFFAGSIGSITSNGYYHPSQRQDTVPDGWKDITDTFDKEPDGWKDITDTFDKEPAAPVAPTAPRTDGNLNPLFVVWKEKNPWYEVDAEMTKFADSIAVKYEKAPLEKVLRKVDEAMRWRWPEKFDKNSNAGNLNPLFVAWKEKNPWYEHDPEMTKYADKIANKIRKEPLLKILQKVDTAVRWRWPEKFDKSNG